LVKMECVIFATKVLKNEYPADANNLK